MSTNKYQILINRQQEEFNKFPIKFAFNDAQFKQGMNELGLDEIDRKVLETIIIKYAGGPVGVETLAATIGEEVETIEDVYEPFLMQLGFISRTPRGRIALEPAYKHIGVEFNK